MEFEGLLGSTLTSYQWKPLLLPKASCVHNAAAIPGEYAPPPTPLLFWFRARAAARKSPPGKLRQVAGGGQTHRLTTNPQFLQFL